MNLNIGHPSMEGQITLMQFMIEEQKCIAETPSEIILLLSNIAIACKRISHTVNRGSINNMLGNAKTENIQGETQKHLDIITNEIMIDLLKSTGHLSGMVSEEVDAPISIPKKFRKGKYLALFDPLDGSSNIDVNITVGTIFSILRGQEGVDATFNDFLQKGMDQVCAGFVLYGPSTMMILTTGHGVNCFTLDQNVGEFVLTHVDMKIPKNCAEFSINMSNQRFWEPAVQRYVAECIQGEDGLRNKNFNMRWVASMVAEVYRILIRGGIFMYPYDNRDPAKPGKLRLMYEANPMAFIVEQAGGFSSTGREPILEITPNHIHQRIPVILGSKNEVDRLVSYH